MPYLLLLVSMYPTSPGYFRGILRQLLDVLLQREVSVKDGESGSFNRNRRHDTWCEIPTA
jgi:hypothetical protein